MMLHRYVKTIATILCALLVLATALIAAWHAG